MELTKSNQLLKLSKRYIPGGSTFNKTNFFDQGLTPFSLSHGKGVKVWDVDGNLYTDYILGLGSVVFGYCCDEIDCAVMEQLKKGMSFSLMHPLELEVARKLVETIPCAEMVRFGKNGSDVLSAAVRLARFITAKDHVAFCGYHGWHDWCIAKTSRPGGIPESVRNLSHRFVYNDVESLYRLIKDLDGQIGCIVMDVVARYYPEPGFLEAVRELTTKYHILLIFDEIVTGFRIHRGGAQAFFNVTPDLACFGKGIANGMPISVLVGKEECMRRFDEIFFSLTFAGETLSLAAANAVLDIHQQIDIAGELQKKGDILRRGLEEALVRHGLNKTFAIQGMPSRLILGFAENLDPTSFITQEEKTNRILSFIIRGLAEKGILFNSSIFVSYSHTMEDVQYFLDSFNQLCPAIGEELAKLKSNGKSQ